jgi:agmatine deiminase
MNIIFVAACLTSDKNSKGVHFGVKTFQELNALKSIKLVRIENHSNNVWCRDYMPVRRKDGEYVQFTYRPSYMEGMDKYANMFPNSKELHNELGIKPIAESEIKLDGGAIEIFEDQAIISDRVFRDNSNISIKDVITEIKEILLIEKLTIVPEFPGDYTGHVDGLVRFINENTVIVNDESATDFRIVKSKYYRSKMENQWFYSFRSSLINAGYELEYLPMAEIPTGKEEPDYGLYINFLKLDELILMPSFKNEKDEIAAQKLNSLYKLPIEMIDATDLYKEGGLINCVTWTK